MRLSKNMDVGVFRQYDIRGIYKKEITQEFSYKLGEALVMFMENRQKGKKISIGHDSRLSSPALYSSLIKGLYEHGAHVFKLGHITTPVSYFSAHKISDMSMTVMVTGSHNPPEYNGFKLTMNKSSLTSKDIKQIRKLMSLDSTKKTGKLITYDIVSDYIDYLKKQFKFKENLEIIIDCGNGASGVLLRKLFNALGLVPKILHESPDGNFPNRPPDPTIEENLKTLSSHVSNGDAVCGIAFDGDADRICVVDENGKLIQGDKLLYIFSKEILKNNRGAKIVADVKCSDNLFSSIGKLGGQSIMHKTGHSLIKQKIKEVDAFLGGELSGHICFNDRTFGYDDAVYASLRFLEILLNTKKKVSELLRDYPKSFVTPEIREKYEEDKIESLIKKIKKTFEKNELVKLNTLDGVRVSFPNGWALIRKSHTESVGVFRYEANTKQNLQKIIDQVKALKNENH